MAYGNTSVYARPNGVSSTRQCKEGYHRHALARDDVPVCHSGSWVLHTTIYDASVTPATFCVSNGQYTETTQSFCYLKSEISIVTVQAGWYRGIFYGRQYEPRSGKIGLRGFRPGRTKTGLYSHRRWLEA